MPFQEAYPERYFEMGIAEQNIASTAAGLALAGKIPFIHSFAVFASGRAYDQIRQEISIPGLNVRICGSSYGLSDLGRFYPSGAGRCCSDARYSQYDRSGTGRCG